MKIGNNMKNAIIIKKMQIVEGKSNHKFGKKCNEIDL